jgi:hypothetical protein
MASNDRMAGPELQITIADYAAVITAQGSRAAVNLVF